MVSSANLLRMHSVPSSRSLIKIINKTGPKTEPWVNTACDWLPAGFNSVHHSSVGSAIQMFFYLLARFFFLCPSKSSLYSQASCLPHWFILWHIGTACFYAFKTSLLKYVHPGPLCPSGLSPKGLHSAEAELETDPLPWEIMSSSVDHVHSHNQRGTG